MNNNFKLITSINKRLYDHNAQRLVNNVYDIKYPITIYHECSYENNYIQFPVSDNIDTIDIWQLPEYKFWIGNFISSPDTPWNNIKLHNGFLKKEQAKFWFRKVLSIVHAVLNSKTEYVIWCDADAYFENKLDDTFWDFVKNYNISCIYRNAPHIESGFVVYKTNETVKKLMREYLGFYVSGDVWKYPRWCDGSVLTYLLKNEHIGKFKNIEFHDDTCSEFDISYYFKHIKDPFKEVRHKEI